jgi:hypothetical protein
MIVEFRQRTLLPLDDALGCLKDTISKLTRSDRPVALSGTASLACQTARTTLPNEAGSRTLPIGYV